MKTFGSEHDLQVACVQWFRLQYPNMMMFAIPNGGKRHIAVARKMKAEGVLVGVADLFLAQPTELLHGLFIEIKMPKNYQTDAQKEFELYCKSRGYGYEVCKSFDQFKDVVESYLNIRLQPIE